MVVYVAESVGRPTKLTADKTRPRLPGITLLTKIRHMQIGRLRPPSCHAKYVYTPPRLYTRRTPTDAKNRLYGALTYASMWGLTLEFGRLQTSAPHAENRRRRPHMHTRQKPSDADILPSGFWIIVKLGALGLRALSNPALHMSARA